jgi:hypothetical protein
MTDAEYLRWFNKEFWGAIEGRGVSSLSRLQRDALCVMNFQAEINNGGIHQYFFNSSGDLAKETPEVFRRIGAEKAASILEEGNALFGPEGPPIDREARMEALLRFSKSAEDRIDALSEAFYDAEDCGLCLADLLDAYILGQKRNGG